MFPYVNHYHSDTQKATSSFTQGEGSPDKVFNVIKDGWGAVATYSTYANERITVDTEHGRIVISFQVTCNLDARRGMTNIATNKLAFILLLDPKTKKVTRWTGIWDNNDESVREAFAKLGMEVPHEKKPTMPITMIPITLDEGKAFAAKYLQKAQSGFKKNNHSELMADMVSSVCDLLKKWGGSFLSYPQHLPHVPNTFVACRQPKLGLV